MTHWFDAKLFKCAVIFGTNESHIWILPKISVGVHACTCACACTCWHMSAPLRLLFQSSKFFGLTQKNSNVRSFLGQEGVKFEICAKSGAGYMGVRMYVHVCTHTYMYLHTYILWSTIKYQTYDTYVPQWYFEIKGYGTLGTQQLDFPGISWWCSFGRHPVCLKFWNQTDGWGISWWRHNDVAMSQWRHATSS